MLRCGRRYYVVVRLFGLFIIRYRRFMRGSFGRFKKWYGFTPCDALVLPSAYHLHSSRYRRIYQRWFGLSVSHSGQFNASASRDDGGTTCLSCQNPTNAPRSRRNEKRNPKSPNRHQKNRTPRADNDQKKR